MKKLYVLIVVVLCLLALSVTPLFKTRDVYFNGKLNNNHSIALQMRELNWIWTSAADMVRLIESNKLYDAAVVEKRFPLDINISLVERDAFIAIKSGGYYVIIDIYGVVLALSDTPDAPYVIEGFNVTSALLGEHLIAEEMKLIERAVQIVYMFETYTSYQPKVSLVDGQIIQTMTEEISVNFGRAEDVEQQFNNAVAVYKDMIDKGSTSGVVNVSDPDKPYIEPLKR